MAMRTAVHSKMPEVGVHIRSSKDADESPPSSTTASSRTAKCFMEPSARASESPGATVATAVRMMSRAYMDYVGSGAGCSAIPRPRSCFPPVGEFKSGIRVLKRRPSPRVN
jgi:hypothetical protein